MTTFRALNPNLDYPRMAEILSQLESEPTSAAELHEEDQARPKDTFLFREVALDDAGEVIGWNRVERRSTHSAGHYNVRLKIHPKARGQGVGAELFNRVVEALRDAKPVKMFGYVRDDEAFSIRFAEKRGFQIERQQFDSKLNLETFDETLFAGVIEAVEATGIRFSSLANEGDTDANRRRLYELNKITVLDIPGFDSEFEPFEQFSKWVFEASWYDPEGQILAISGNEYVGLGSIGFKELTKSVQVELTGVHPDYRGRHLALAIKLLGIRFAKARGAAYCLTNNDSQNAPMLHINRDKLGFVAEPGFYKMVLEV